MLNNGCERLRGWAIGLLAATTAAALGCGGGDAISDAFSDLGDDIVDGVEDQINDFEDQIEDIGNGLEDIGDEFTDDDPDLTPDSIAGLSLSIDASDGLSLAFTFASATDFSFTGTDGGVAVSGTGTYVYVRTDRNDALLDLFGVAGPGTAVFLALRFDSESSGTFTGTESDTNGATTSISGTFTLP